MANIGETKPEGDEQPMEVIHIENPTSLATPEDENHPDEMVPALTNPPGIVGISQLPELGHLVGAGSEITSEVLPGAATVPPTLVLPLPEEPKAEKKKLVAMFVKDEDLRELWDRASQVRSDIITSINDASVALQLLDQIEVARNEMLAGREYYEQAERHISEVELRIALNQRAKTAANSLGVWLFIYETVWAAVLLIFLFVVLGPAAFSSAAIPSSNWSSPDVVFLLGSMTWGALGGVIGAWLSLVRHISKDQDFDRQHLLWYINSPVMGIGVGAVIFLVLRAGLLSITGPTESISSPLVIYLLAWLSGFQQNVFTDLIRRLLQVFKIDADEEDDVEPTTVLHPPMDAPKANLSTNGRA